MPDANPRYQKMPRPESIKKLAEVLTSKRIVQDVSQDGPQVLKVTRVQLPELRIHVTNIYIVGKADVIEILAADPDVNCIVTVSAWNRWSDDANEYAISEGVGLFEFGEMVGAVFRHGADFLDFRGKSNRPKDD